MCVNWIPTIASVLLVSAALVMLVWLDDVPAWSIAACGVLWTACFCADARLTLKFGRRAILEFESNAVFRALYSRLGTWSVPAHLALESAGIAGMSLAISWLSSGSLDSGVLAVCAMMVLAGEHAVAFFENRRARSAY